MISSEDNSLRLAPDDDKGQHGIGPRYARSFWRYASTGFCRAV
jgi:hypothetical protein